MLDASLMVEWLIGENRRSVARDAYDALADTSVRVPSHWPVEVSNALRSEIRAGRLAVDGFHRILDQLDLLDIRVESPIDLDEITPLAQFATTHDLTAYDAAYVQLTLQRRATLATLDRAMRNAAKRLHISLLPSHP
ncbi:MAG: type II toxin-antitoxin system VapC family toxin [Xanthobacteraceae bacterium]